MPSARPIDKSIVPRGVTRYSTMATSTIATPTIANHRRGALLATVTATTSASNHETGDGHGIRAGR